jgi:hypothetical protein
MFVMRDLVMEFSVLAHPASLQRGKVSSQPNSSSFDATFISPSLQMMQLANKYMVSLSSSILERLFGTGLGRP